MAQNKESADTQNEIGTDIDGRTGEPIEEAEDELSKYETRDSAPEPNAADMERMTNRPSQ
jgi:hypothetical protein